jgi:hypothetical protein
MADGMDALGVIIYYDCTRLKVEGSEEIFVKYLCKFESKQELEGRLDDIAVSDKETAIESKRTYLHHTQKGAILRAYAGISKD